MDSLEFAKSQRAAKNREKWRKLVAKSSVVPRWPSRWRDRWDEMFWFLCHRYGSVENYLEYIGFGSCEQENLRRNFLDECNAISPNQSSDGSFSKHRVDWRQPMLHVAPLCWNRNNKRCHFPVCWRKLLASPDRNQPGLSDSSVIWTETDQSCWFGWTVLNIASVVSFFSKSGWKLSQLSVLLLSLTETDCSCCKLRLPENSPCCNTTVGLTATHNGSLPIDFLRWKWPRYVTASRLMKIWKLLLPSVWSS